MRFDTFDREQERKPARPYTEKDAGFLEITAAAFEYNRDNMNIDAAERLTQEEFEGAEKRAKELLGDQYDIRSAPDFNAEKYDATPNMRGEYVDKNRLHMEYYDSLVKKLKGDDPEKYASLETMEDVRGLAKARAKESERKFFDTQRRSVGGMTSLFGSLAGGFGASMTDPLNLLTMPIGAGAGKGLLKTIAIEAGLNAGIEGVSQQYVEQWQKEIGNDYGIKDKAEAVGMAALFGGGMAGLGKGIGKGIEAAKARGIFSKIGANDKAPRQARTAAKALERNHHVIENSPFIGGGQERHLKIFDEIMTQVNRGEDINFSRVDFADTEFNKIDTRIFDTDDELAVIQKKEIEKFQTESLTPEQHKLRDDLVHQEILKMKKEASELDPTVRLEALDQAQMREQARWQNKINNMDEAKLKKAFKTRKGKRYRQFRKIAEERLENGYIKSDGSKAMASDEFIEASTSRQSKAEPKTPNKFDEEYGLGKPESISLQRQMEVNKELMSSEHMKAVETDFSRAVEIDPNKKIVIEGEDGKEVVLTMKELQDQMDNDSKILKEITSCGIGS